MKITLHRIVLYILIRYFPNLFKRYYAEYKYTDRKYKIKKLLKEKYYLKHINIRRAKNDKKKIIFKRITTSS